MYLSLVQGPVGIAHLSPAESAALAARHGFRGVDLPVRDLAPTQITAVRDLAARHGIVWSFFWSPVDVFTDDEERYRSGLAAFARAAPLAAAADCRRTYNHIWPGHDTRHFEENFEFHVRRLRPVAAIAAEHGLLFGLEFIGTPSLRTARRHPFIYTLPQTVDLIRAVGAGVGLVLDTFHWHNSGGTVDDLAAHLPHVPIVNVHCNDAVPGVPPEAVEDLTRAMPGETGVIDLRGALGALRAAGYDGPLMCEPFDPWRSRLAKLTPDEAAAEVRRWMAPLLT